MLWSKIDDGPSIIQDVLGNSHAASDIKAIGGLYDAVIHAIKQPQLIIDHFRQHVHRFYSTDPCKTGW
eukprot:XP_001705307.1 Hypothetical protein GL50803_35570 [Giardia lamblia ATCC 50803]